jgi:hypothetical protein
MTYTTEKVAAAYNIALELLEKEAAGRSAFEMQQAAKRALQGIAERKATGGAAGALSKVLPKTQGGLLNPFSTQKLPTRVIGGTK